MENKYACQATLLQQQQQFEERILEHLAFNSDILERWHQIGSSQGLTTDLEVATFLIQHYENTWDRAQPTDFCLTCHSPLALTCTKCTPTPTNTTHPHPHSHSSNHHHDNPLSPLFSPSSNATFPIDSLPSKGKKRKKAKKLMAERMPGIEDEDLMGLYIQFGQSSNPTTSDFGVSLRDGKYSHKKASPKSRRSSHTDEQGKLKSFVCMHCAKTIFKLSDFKKHVRTHTREKPYKCQHCEAAFSDASSAARHRRVHTGEKPFKCKVCPSSFAQSSDLTKHMRVHTQERPWKCPVCEKTFGDISQFGKHRRQHEKEAKKMMTEELDLITS